MNPIVIYPREKGLSPAGRRLMEMFDLMLDHFGPQNWWPADDAMEMMVGAILTQNTNWKNVEKAIDNLKKKKWLSLKELHMVSVQDLAELIKPAGYFNIKAKRLKNFVAFMMEAYGGNLSRFFEERTPALRSGLLSVKGIGPETADSILLYAAHRPVFVVDAYTYRVLHRHGLADEQATYDDIQAIFMDHLPEEPGLFNEFHALIVRTGKNYCKRIPFCNLCPLESWGPSNALSRH